MTIPPTSRLGPRPTAALVIGILLQVTALGWGLHQLSDQPAYHDGIRYMRMMRRYSDVIEAGGPTQELLHELNWAHETHPPLIPLSFAGSAALFGDTPSGAAAVNLLYLALTQVLIAAIAVQLGWRWIGVYAALLFGLIPVVWYHALQPLLEVGLAFWVAAAIWMLLRSERFASTRWSLAFGVTCGLGLLAKWTFVLFVAPVALLVVATPGLNCPSTSGEAEVSRRRRLLNLAALVLVASLVSLSWYAPHAEAVLEFARFNELSGMYAGNTSRWDWIYVAKLPYILSPPALLAFAVALPIALVATRLRFLVPALWLGVPFVVFSFLSTKAPNGRHFVPAMPALALLTLIGLRRLPAPRAYGRALRHLAPIGLLACLVPTYLYHVAAVEAVPAKLAGWPVRFGNTWSQAGSDWHVADALEAIEHDARKRGTKQPSIVVLCHRNPRVDDGTFRYLAVEHGVSGRFVRLPFWVEIGNPYHEHPPFEEVLEADYLVAGMHPERAPPMRSTFRNHAFIQDLLQHPGASEWLESYTPIYRVPLPLFRLDLVVLRRTKSLAASVEVEIVRQLLSLGDPDHLELYGRLARLCRELGREDSACAAEALARAVEALEEHRPDDALSSYAQAVRLDPATTRWFGRETIRALIEAFTRLR